MKMNNEDVNSNRSNRQLGHSDRPSGSQLLLDPDAVVLSVIDDRLVISTPADLDPDFHARHLLPGGYFHISESHRSLSAAEPVVSMEPIVSREPAVHRDPVRSERRVIARAQARSVATRPELSRSVGVETSRPDSAARLGRSVDAPRAIDARVIVDPRLTERPDNVRRERHQRSRRRLGRALLVIVVTTVVAAAVFQSSLLRVTDVHVTGNSDLSAQAVIDSLQVASEPSMLSVKSDDLRDRLIELPLIADAKVWKSWPNTLNVQIIERFGVAAIEVPGGWAVIDQTGVVIERRTVRPTLPTVFVDGEPVSAALIDNPQAINDAIRPALIALAGAPSTLMVLTEQAMVTGQEVTLALRRGPLLSGGGKAKDRPTEPLLVSFGRATDIEAKWKAIDVLRAKVQLDKYATVDLSVAAQPALVRPTLPVAIPAIPVVPALPTPGKASTDIAE